MDPPALARIADRIRAAAADERPLRIHGGSTKDFYGEALVGEALDVRELSGIVSYAPGELVLTARAGTPLADVEAALDEHGQMLAFEPPVHGVGATLGGVIAAGFSGPRRAYAGAARDFVLGVRVIDGVGESLAFGGQVIKNVAGFDVSRLMTGALGTLGVIAEVSLKCLPKPKAETTCVIDCDGASALRSMNEWGGKPLPITATCFRGGRLWVRLSGAAPAVESAQAALGGKSADEGTLWRDLRDQRLDFFTPVREGAHLWRLSMPSTAPWSNLPGDQLIEWGGALRWVVTRDATSASAMRAWAGQQGGHATLYRSGANARDPSVGVFHPLPSPILELHRNLKRVFDPKHVLNRGRLYPAF